jgi:hypothetical protein
VRRAFAAAVVLLAVPAWTAACASLAGIKDVPNLVDGGSHDATTKDVGRGDAQGKLDANRDASGDAKVNQTPDSGGDAGVDASPGCQVPTDCPAGEACNSATGACGTTCSAAAACNGGCCNGADAGLCVTGDASTACGNGSICTVCTGATSSCSGGTCVGNCTGSACATGECCVSGGACQAGTTQTSCGSKTACADCAGDSHGFMCISDKCGCATEADCPLHTACSPAGQCVDRCRITDGGAVSTCNGGCCNSEGYCAFGTAPPSCGRGSVCSVCTGENGAACLDGGICGCRTPADCHAQNTCTDRSCTSACGGSGNSACHDSCCSGGMCQVGDQPAACGKAGGSCDDCMTACTGGTGCNELPGTTTFGCSCRVAQDCPASACGSRTDCTRTLLDGGVLPPVGRCTAP